MATDHLQVIETSLSPPGALLVIKPGGPESIAYQRREWTVMPTALIILGHEASKRGRQNRIDVVGLGQTSMFETRSPTSSPCCSSADRLLIHTYHLPSHRDHYRHSVIVGDARNPEFFVGQSEISGNVSKVT